MLPKSREFLYGLLVIVAALAIAFFLVENSGRTRSPEPQPIDKSIFPTLQKQPDTPLTIEGIENASIYGSLSENVAGEFISIGDSQNPISLTDGVGSTYFCSYLRYDREITYLKSTRCSDSLTGSAPATSTKQGEGTVELSFIQIQNLASSTVLNNVAGDELATAILTFNRGTTGVERYFVLLNSYYNRDRGIVTISSQAAKKFPENETPRSVEWLEDGVIVLHSVTPGGFSKERAFLTADVRHGGLRLVELTPDRKSKVYTENLLDFQFTYPRDFYTIASGYSRSGRAPEVEKVTGKSPVYFSESCGLEQTLGDRTYFLNDGKSFSRFQFTVHDIKSEVVYLSTALYGYDPLQWGTVTGSLSISAYVQSIWQNDPISGKDVESITVNGQTIRHIFPYTQGRPCDRNTYEQYQWVQDGFLMNFVVTEPISQEGTVLNVTETLEELISSFEVI